MDRVLDLSKLKLMIKSGVGAIPQDPKHQEAVLVIGDTGVGKSTILSALSGAQLFVRIEGMKAVLDAKTKEGVKIGHDKFSETSIPTKVVINDTVFFDCPGFKDNKGEEFEISNSFFIQRLLDIYSQCKILLVIDESHVTQARADKLPKLLSNLLKSFRTFQDIKEGVILVINRAQKDLKVQQYHHQIVKMSQLKNESGYLFEQESRSLLEYLVKHNRISLFREAQKDQKDKKFQSEAKTLLQLVHQIKSIKSRHINNIISESAKLAIRDYIDQVASQSSQKIEQLCAQIRREYTVRRSEAQKNINQIISIKEEIIALLDAIKQAKGQELIDILLMSVPPNKILTFQEEFSAVMFFKNIYDKTEAYYNNILNKIYSQISPLLAHFDKEIIKVQKEEEEKARYQKELKEAQVREEKRKAEYEENLRKTQEELLAMKDLNNQFQQLKVSNNDTKSCLEETIKKWRDDQQDLVSIKKQWAEDSKIKDTEIDRIETALRLKTAQLEQVNRDSETMSIAYMGLQEELDQSRASISVSTTSKKSKYQEIDCPHFKNGGKCIHCINKWKSEHRKH